MPPQISYILVRADDVDDAIGEAEAVLEPGNWDFFTMVTAIDGDGRSDGLKPVNASDIGVSLFITRPI